MRQAQILQQQLSPHELAYQESLIQEREAEIRDIESGMHELAEIFRDLGTLVGEQGQMIGEFSRSLPNTSTNWLQMTLAITYSPWRMIQAKLRKN